MPADQPDTSGSRMISVADYGRAAEASLHPGAFGYYTAAPWKSDPA
jgi:hypothetical protein